MATRKTIAWESWNAKLEDLQVSQAEETTEQEMSYTEIENATIPILYGSIGSALSTTRSVAKHERFGLITGRLYAWAGFPIMWGIIAKKRTKNTGMKPKELWHHLLDEWTKEIGNKPFFGGDEPHIVDLAVYGYMKSIEMHNKAFRLIQDHSLGMEWFNRMKNAATVE